MTGRTITYHDDGPDDLGRRRFTVDWDDSGGIFRPEIHFDGEPVGHRRAQVFFCDPSRLEGGDDGE